MNKISLQMSVSHVNTGYSVNQDSKTFTIMPL